MPPKTVADAKEAGDLITGMENLAIASRRGMQETLDGCPPRPGYGTAGKAIKVAANMYESKFKGPGATVLHYDIDINPVVKVTNQKKPRALLQAVWDQMVAEVKGELKQALDAAAYDQVKNFYTPFAVPGHKAEVKVALKEDGKEAKKDERRFKVVMQLVNKVDLSTIEDYCHGMKQSADAKEMMLTAIQAMNVLFRQDPAKKYVMSGAAGRRFFSEEGGIPLSNGGILYPGFQQSFRWTSTQHAALQIDTAYSAFIEPGMLPDVCARLLGMGGGGGFSGRGGRGGRGFDRGGRGGGGRGGGPAYHGGGAVPAIQDLNPNQIRRLNDYLKTAKFKVAHRNTDRLFSINKITTQPAEALKFTLSGKDGKPDRQIGIVQYYKEMYNRQVTRPRLPCVQYGKNNYIPLEFLFIFHNTRIPGLTTLHIIRHAAKPPPERQAAIDAWRRRLDYTNMPKVKAWGVQINKKMMEMGARVLNPPNILYGGNKTLRANFGAWNLKAVKFTKPGMALKSWSVISFDERCGVPDLQKFITFFVGQLNAYGCTVENRQPDCMQWNPHAAGSGTGIKAGLQEAARKAYMKSKINPQLIIVIMPRKDVAMYKEIKSVAAEGLLKPVVTQCLQSQKIKSDRGLDQYCGNVAMKVHVKLGGITHQVSHGIDSKTMMIGADVTHPPPREGLIQPSIAVSVCAINGENNKFAPAIRLQEGRVEIIQDLENMVHDHILTFEKNTKAKPEKILFFRDGVSEGQYSHCVQYEVEAVKRAARRFPKYMPKITFVICAKRHAMRFFATSEADVDRTKNLPAGTIVDTTVTSPMVHDFYLQAHAGLQGTARPTHYVVVADENKYTADKLQKLVNDLCYTYARASRSVSLVPVAYYADIVAERVRDWVYSEDFSEAASTAPSSGSGGPRRRETVTFDPLRLKKRIENEPDFNNVAWYM
ncbi:uncharacterized protein I303_102029 [Kwoniella dejecticola CBS 10117]|uniref:Argonaute n=1 Tax=Kwoniella dejecticola CBS 10117 TaxID=1296121 RepID=A0AAJ8KKQ1_9TREE